MNPEAMRTCSWMSGADLVGWIEAPFRVLRENLGGKTWVRHGRRCERGLWTWHGARVAIRM